MNYYLGPYVSGEVAPGVPALLVPDGCIGHLDLRSSAAVRAGSQEHCLFVTPRGVTLGRDWRLLGAGHMSELFPGGATRLALASAMGLADLSGASLQDWLWNALTVRADPAGDAACKPLMPTRGRRVELHLGGHDVRRRRFDLAAPEFAPALEVMRRDYRAWREAARAGRMKDDRHHRRMLDALGEKFGVRNPEDIFIPADLPRETRLPHETTLTDNFNRADAGALGTASGGFSWTQVLNSIAIVSNEAKSTGSVSQSNRARAESDLSSDDHYAQASCTAISSTGGVWGTIVRYDSAADSGYLSLHRLDSSQNRVFKLTAGGLAQVGTTNTDALPSRPFTSRLEINGSSITLAVNGATKVSTTDGTYTGQTRCGQHLSYSGSEHNNADSWEAGDLAASASLIFKLTPIPPALLAM